MFEVFLIPGMFEYVNLFVWEKRQEHDQHRSWMMGNDYVVISLNADMICIMKTSTLLSW